MNKLLYLFILLYSSTLNAQIDRERFDAIFEEEFTASKYTQRDNHSAVYLYAKPQSVPSWFINPPMAEHDEVYAIGISDPEMDITIGLEVAIKRAKVLANVLYEGTTQLLCDFFLSEAEHTSEIVFEHFSRISTKIPSNGAFELIQSYRNEFDETMVLIKYIPAANSEYDIALFELYKNEIEVAKRIEYESVYELLVKPNEGDDTLDMYQLTEFGKRHDVLSKVNKEIVQVPIYQLKYTGIPNNDSTDVQFFSHGLWKEYLKSLMLNIIGVARLKPENIQYMGGTYQYENMEKLTRGISVNKMRFAVTGVSSFQNELKLNLIELPLNKRVQMNAP